MGRARRRLVFGLLAACALVAPLLLPVTKASAAETCIQPNRACTSWDPTSGPPGTKVTITGKNWPSSYAGQSSEVSWGFTPNNTVATITVSGSGTFTADIAVPGNAPVGKTSIDVNGNFTLGRNLDFEVTAASRTPPSQAAVTVGRALTLDANSNPTRPREKTSFAPGDPIWYAVIVTVPGSSPATITFTWEGNGPRRIFFDKNTVAIKPGTSSVYSPGTIPKDAPGGTYSNRDTVTVGGRTEVRESRFTVKALEKPPTDTSPPTCQSSSSVSSPRQGTGWAKTQDFANYLGTYGGQTYNGYHPAEDWGAAARTEVAAIGAGKVVWIGKIASGGQLIAIEHNGPFKVPAKDATSNGQKYGYPEQTVPSVYSIYMHVSPRSGVVAGDCVTKGQVIATLAAIAAPHLHFEIRLPSHTHSKDWSLVGESRNWKTFPKGGYNGYHLNVQAMVNYGVRDPSEFLGANP